MRWNRPHFKGAGWLRELLYIGGLALGCVFGLLLLSASSAEDKKLSIYAPQTTASVAVHDRNGVEYVVLSEALEPLGELTARADGSTWKVRLGKVEGEFRAGQTRARVGRNALELAAPFLVDGSRGLVPASNLGGIVARYLDSRVDFHTSSRRLFVAGTATRFTLEMKKDQALVLNFSAPVNPTIATEPGMLVMSFNRDPVLSGAGNFQFADDKLVTGVRYAESNGSADVTVLSGTPLIAEFSEGGKTITVSAAPRASQTPPPPPPAEEPPPSVEEPALPVSPTSPVAVPSALTAGAPRYPYLVIVDAGHGGEERGAALSESLVEKEVTLALARRLRAELQNRGVAAALLRDGDQTLSFDQRAVAANAARAAVYISLHATGSGAGIRVYTPMLTSAAPPAGPFVPWDTAQAPFLSRSMMLANAIDEAAGKSGAGVALMPAPVRPLNNIAAAAIAVEITPPRREVESLASAQYQQQVAQILAAGIAGARSKLMEAR